MKTPKHTPGPWIVQKQNHRMRVVRKIGEPGDPGFAYRKITYDWPEQRSSAKKFTSPSYYGWHEIDEANARLIAAAPELLEALQEAANLLTIAYSYSPTGGEVWKLYPKVWNNARNAIAKATGEPR